MAKLKFTISIATSKDVELLVNHRLKMVKEIFPQYALQVQDIEDRTSEWIAKKLSEGKLIGFIAKTRDGQAVGSGCIWIRETQPSVISPCLEAPYLMSVYTEEGFRRRGVARLVAQTALSYCRSHGYDRINLHASENARPLYESLGFEPTSEMRLWLN